MIQRTARPLWLLVTLALVVWSSFDLVTHYNPISTRSGGESNLGDSFFSLGGLVRDVVEPKAILIAALCALIVGRWSGVCNAFRFVLGGLGMGGEKAEQDDRRLLGAGNALAAAGRGLLWGTFLINAEYLSRLPWNGDSLAKRDFFGVEIWKVLSTPIFALSAGALFLLPLSNQALRLAGGASDRPHSLASTFFGGIDKLAVFGLLVISLLFVLTQFQAGVLQSSEAIDYFTITKPTFDALRLDLALWSLVFTLVMAGVASLFSWLGSQQIMSWGMLANVTLAASGLAAVMVLNASIGWVAQSGGQANSRELQGPAGQTVFAMGIGIALFLVFRVLHATRSKPA